MREAALWLAGFEAWALVVFALALLLDRGLQRRSAALRRGLLALAVVVVLMLPLTRLVLAPPLIVFDPALAGVLVGVWLLGATGLIVGFIRSSVAAWRLVAASSPILAPAWQDDLERLQGDRPRMIELRSHPRLATPICVGLRRSIIVVPTSMLACSDEQRRGLLAHELAHAIRSDVALLAMGSLARALCWIDPLAWLALERLREHAESAADDAVLDAGIRSSSYAAQLVALARAQLEPRGGGLRGRVLAILDAERSRSGSLVLVPRWSGAGLLALALACASMLTACEARADASPVERVVRDGP